MQHNTLINLLPQKIQDRIFSTAEEVAFDLSQVIHKVNSPIEHIYFPVDGFISLIQGVEDSPTLEIGMVGREGVLGAEIALGVDHSLFGAIVQGSGSAWQIGVKEFSSALSEIPELRKIMHAYIAVRISQLGLSAACEHFHEIGPRLAKWLLMSQDRAQSSTFLMTHEFIALMLGVRRVGITTTAADFRRRGLIEYHRGEMKVLNRVALKAEACSCYQNNQKIFSALIH
jgi:CRP-like cAMP-binding protein